MAISNKIVLNLEEHIACCNKVLSNKELLCNIDKVANLMVECFNTENKVLFCGNGGSAADAQHLAAEFSGKFMFNRAPLFSEALHVNSSFLTAVANDFGFENVYSRLLEAKGKKGDILVGISTSGNSLNILNAFKVARELGVITIALTGENPRQLATYSDYILNVPSSLTPIIQELHIHIGHTICGIVEETIFGNPVTAL